MSSLQELERSAEIPVFQNWLKDFVRQHKSDVVVDIGSDMQLTLAFALAPLSGIVHSVNFSREHIRMKLSYRASDIKRSNVKLTSGDALKLGNLIPHANIILVHNVLLDGNNGEDTKLMWQYRRDEVEYIENDWQTLLNRFNKAEQDGFTEFLRVANPGYIIKFGRVDEEDNFMKTLTEKIGVDSANIERRRFLYGDGDKEQWEAYIIDNSQK